MPKTISSDYNNGLGYTPVDGDEAICENAEASTSDATSSDYDYLSADDGADPRAVAALTGSGGATQADGSSEGANSVGSDDEPVARKSSGGVVYALDGNVGAVLAAVGVQGAVVLDDECGLGFVGSLAEGVQTPGVGANLTLGVTEYVGSFERFNDSYQVAAGGGALVYGEGRVFIDSETGEPIGTGVAAGVGTPGLGASVSHADSAVYFPACPQD